MKQHKKMLENRGFYGIGIFNTVIKQNLGTLYRSALALNASFIFNIGRKYKVQASDTSKSFKHIPFYEYATFDEFYENLPKSCRLVGVELCDESKNLYSYVHPESCVYLLGSEGDGIPPSMLKECHDIIQIPSSFCLNVATAGTVIMYDRLCKLNKDCNDRELLGM